MHSCRATFGPFNYKMGITLFTVALLILSGRLYAFSGLDFLYKHRADHNNFFCGVTCLCHSVLPTSEQDVQEATVLPPVLPTSEQDLV